MNFLGWYLCVFTFYVISALTLRLRGPAEQNRTIRSQVFWLMPILMYPTRVTQYFIVPFVVPNRQITSNDGHVWLAGDITQSLLLVSIFTMIFMCLLAALRVMRSPDLK